MTTRTRNDRRMLGADEERRLVEAAQAGDAAAMTELVEAYRPLVERMALRMGTRGDAFGDMVQEGMAGLLVGIRQFEIDRGFRLGTYARWWIRAHQIDHAREDRVIRFGGSATQRRLLSGMNRAKRSLGIADDGLLTREDARRLSERLDATPEEVIDMHVRMAANAIVSIDAPSRGMEDGACMVEGMADPSHDVAELDNRIDDARRSSVVLSAIAQLDARMQDIVRSRFLVDDVETLEDLSRRHGVSRERIRQLEVKALDEIRGMVPNRLSRPLAA